MPSIYTILTEIPTIKKKTFIPALTGLRTICAYGIFFYHINPFSKENHSILFIIFNQFYSFIPFFFVISAFVIFHTYFKNSAYTKREFYHYFISRFARIFPILIILNLLVFFLSYRDHLYTIGQTIKLFFLNITLAKGFSSEYFLTGIGPSWTNSVEEVFYLAAPLLFIFVTKRFFVLKSTLLFYVTGAIITCCFIAVPFQGFFGSFKFTAYFTFFGRAFEFFCGIYLALLFRGIYNNKYLQKIGKASLFIGLTLLVICYTLLYFIVVNYNVNHANETWPGIIVNNILFPIAIFFILYSLLYYKTFLQKFLSLPVMVNLGNATYSFYLLHTTFVLSYIYKYLGKNIFVAFIAMIIISLVFHRLVEQPIAKLIKRKIIPKKYNKQPQSIQQSQS